MRIVADRSRGGDLEGRRIDDAEGVVPLGEDEQAAGLCRDGGCGTCAKQGCGEGWTGDVHRRTMVWFNVTFDARWMPCVVWVDLYPVPATRRPVVRRRHRRPRVSWVAGAGYSRLSSERTCRSQVVAGGSRCACTGLRRGAWIGVSLLTPGWQG